MPAPRQGGHRHSWTSFLGSRRWRLEEYRWRMTCQTRARTEPQNRRCRSCLASRSRSRCSICPSMSGRILEDHRLRVMQQSNRQLGVFGCWVGCCDSPKSGGIERTEARGRGKSVTWYHQLLGKRKRADGDNAPPHNVISKIRFCA